jgi:hypothetical protein
MHKRCCAAFFEELHRRRVGERVIHTREGWTELSDLFDKTASVSAA